MDIRNLISNSIAINDFFKTFLSKRQKALLMHQKSRVVALDKSEKSFDIDKDTGVLVKFDEKRFE